MTNKSGFVSVLLFLCFHFSQLLLRSIRAEFLVPLNGNYPETLAHSSSGSRKHREVVSGPETLMTTEKL